jgi:hypothetical protein
MYGHSDISLHELNHKGRPYVEIRRNGEPFFPIGSSKKKFQFGRYKALMLLTCREEINRFASTGGREPKSNIEICENNGPYIQICTCTKYDSFETSFGMIVHKPYLRIESNGISIGFGVEKARSIVQLMAEIEEFVAGTL